MHTFTATFRNGETVTRRSDAAYRFASRDPLTGAVRFHGPHAGIPAGREVVGVAADPARPCVVCSGTGTVTYGPSAVDRTMTTVPCHRCHSHHDDRSTS